MVKAMDPQAAHRISKLDEAIDSEIYGVLLLRRCCDRCPTSTRALVGS